MAGEGEEEEEEVACTRDCKASNAPVKQRCHLESESLDRFLFHVKIFPLCGFLPSRGTDSNNATGAPKARYSLEPDT